MGFTVAHETFSGPLGVLLESIERRDLEITKVSLAAVAEDFLRYIGQTKVPPEELADFLLVASRLIYLKSRELMPYLRLDEEEQGVDALAEQLRIYREFAAAATKLEGQYMRSILVDRPHVKLRQDVPKFVAPEGITADRLAEVYRNVLKKLEPFLALTQTSMERVKSVEERIEELESALTARASMSFQDIVQIAPRKIDVVMSFLALLELLRRNIVKVAQTDPWGDIVIHRRER